MPEYSYEFSDYNFSKKMYLLRNFYQLSFRELSSLLNYKSKGNLTFFEKFPMQNKPSYQALINLQQVFGISIDWMLGYSKFPYTNETIQCAEAQQADRFIIKTSTFDMLDVSPKNIVHSFDRPEYIIDSLKRTVFPNIVIQRKLCLADRFVLLFLLNFLSYYMIKFYVEHYNSKILQQLNHLLQVVNGEITLKSETITRHPDYLPAFSKLENALFPQNGEEQANTLNQSVLDERWDFLKYLNDNNIEVQINNRN